MLLPSPSLFKLLLVFLLALPAVVFAAPLGKLVNCTLIPTDWADGDSFLVRSPTKGEFTVRLYGADCLEWHVTDPTDERRLRTQRRYFGITGALPAPRAAIALAKDFGKSATDETRRALSKPFTIHTSFADARGDGRHKRYYAFVTTADGRDLAEILISKGLARAFGVYRETPAARTSADYRAYLADLELQAAKRGAGVWANTDWEKLPAERQQQRAEDEETQLALDSSHTFVGLILDPNTAARDDLMKLPGIGEGLANRIIGGRPYHATTDLLKVSGIGPATLKKLQPHLELTVR